MQSNLANFIHILSYLPPYLWVEDLVDVSGRDALFSEKVFCALGNEAAELGSGENTVQCEVGLLFSVCSLMWKV